MPSSNFIKCLRYKALSIGLHSTSIEKNPSTHNEHLMLHSHRRRLLFSILENFLRALLVNRCTTGIHARESAKVSTQNMKDSKDLN